MDPKLLDDSIGARLRRAVVRLEEKRDSISTHSMERVRLNGKIEGVKLAASYIEENERIFTPQTTEV